MIDPVRSRPGFAAPTRAAAAWLVPAVLALVLGACSSKDDPPPATYGLPDTAAYRGVMAGSGGDAGTLTLTLTRNAVLAGGGDARLATRPSIDGVAATYSVLATFVFGPTRVPATGSYDTATGVISAASAGYSLSGTLLNGKFGGTYARPSRSGGFIAIVPANPSALPYVGTWTGSGVLGPDSGSLGFIVDGTTVAGVARNDDGTLGALDGSRSGGGVLCTFPGYSFTGTLSGGTVSGTYTSSLDGGRAGDWSAPVAGF